MIEIEIFNFAIEKLRLIAFDISNKINNNKRKKKKHKTLPTYLFVKKKFIKNL